MAERKIFAGPQIRRMRNSKGLTQTAMAKALNISPSYLNLIERNQRPLTVQLLLQLSSVFQFELDDLQNDNGPLLDTLKEIFSEPLLAGELPGDSELNDGLLAAPNLAAAFVKMHHAYGEQRTRLADLSELLAREGHATAIAETQMPIDELRTALEGRPNYFEEIDDEAEAFYKFLAPNDDLAQAIKEWLVGEHQIKVRILPTQTMPDLRRRYDRHSKRLFLSERLSYADRLREIAMQAVSLRMRVAIDRTIEKLALSSNEATRIARFECVRYGAHALMMPYAPFLAAAQRARHDIDVLRARFSVSFEQVANRLTTLARKNNAGIPFFMLEIDNAGNRFRSSGANGFPRQRFGGFCPKLCVHSAFAHVGQIIVEAVEMPNGAEFLTIARTLEGLQGSFFERPRRTALMLGCDIAYKDEIVYGQALPQNHMTSGRKATIPAIPVGPSCRLCERSACLARAEPSLTRPVGLDEMVMGLSVFDFQL